MFFFFFQPGVSVKVQETPAYKNIDLGIKADHVLNIVSEMVYIIRIHH